MSAEMPEDEERVIEEIGMVSRRLVTTEEEEHEEHEEDQSGDVLHGVEDVDHQMPLGSVGSNHSRHSSSQEASALPKHSFSKKNGEPAVKKLLDQERFLPIANVVRLMKRIMDPQAKLAKDAKECVQECTSEFISFIAAEAAEMCSQQKRKTILADDLLTAMESLGFDNYAEPMRIFLQKYRQVHKITGPYHHEHANYRRPPQFEHDPPVAPLFFNSDQGDRRCTETKYVINKTEVIKNAPFEGEWNEQTGEHTGTLVDRVQRDDVAEEETIYQGAHMEMQGQEMEEIADEGDGPMGAIALEQQQQMQIYYDPKSKQHYAAKETPNGMELYPLVIQGKPLQLETVDASDGPNFVVNMEDNSDHQLGMESAFDSHMDPNQPSTSSAIYGNDQPHSSHQYYPQETQQYHHMNPPQRQRHQQHAQRHHIPAKRQKMVPQYEQIDEMADDDDHYRPQNPHGAAMMEGGRNEEEDDPMSPTVDEIRKYREQQKGQRHRHQQQDMPTERKPHRLPNPRKTVDLIRQERLLQEQLETMGGSAHQAPIPTLNSLNKAPKPIPPHRAMGLVASPRPSPAGKRTPQKRKK